jgi:hypothetical protein
MFVLMGLGLAASFVMWRRRVDSSALIRRGFAVREIAVQPKGTTGCQIPLMICAVEHPHCQSSRCVHAHAVRNDGPPHTIDVLATLSDFGKDAASALPEYM